MARMHPAAAFAAALLFAGPLFAAEPEAISVDPSIEDVPASRPSASVMEVAATETASENGSVSSEIQTITVSGKRRRLTADLPQTSVGVTARELQDRVFVNTEDALKHAPSVTLRKRYIGDRNALIGGRSHNVLQAPRGVVYADGVLLSNFLGRFNAPRWNMVAPEEIARVDVLYGPYSAIYPGNSIGTTVLVTTRDPVQPTLSGRAQFFTQSYSEYGFDKDYGGSQLSLFGGNSWGNWSGSLGVNQLRSESHPMQYATGTRVAAPSEAQQASAVDVTGAIADFDPKGAPRLILGPNGGSR
ncbi:MAG: TonB-dependent receptor plug domain-containing protein, partial [Panacagrimonas sp.]